MAHAWLLTGPPGSGRSVAARAFAAALLCPAAGLRARARAATRCAPARHADLMLVRPDGLSYGVKQTRDLVLRAATAPAGGRWHVVLFEDADRATEAAANALLKAIEEPAPRTVWLLCAPSAEDLLADDPVPVPAGRRCGPRRRPRSRTCWSGGTASIRQRALAAARAAQGHIGRARRLATDAEAARRRDEVLRIPLGRDRPRPGAHRGRVPGQGGRGGGQGGHRGAGPARARRAAAGVRRGLDRQGRGEGDPRRRGRAAGPRGPAEVAGHPGQAGHAGRCVAGPGLRSTATCWRCSSARRWSWATPAARRTCAGWRVAATPEATVRRIEAIMACRERLALNVAPLLAVEEMTLALLPAPDRWPAVRDPDAPVAGSPIGDACRSWSPLVESSGRDAVLWGRGHDDGGELRAVRPAVLPRSRAVLRRRSATRCWCPPIRARGGRMHLGAAVGHRGHRRPAGLRRARQPRPTWTGTRRTGASAPRPRSPPSGWCASTGCR